MTTTFDPDTATGEELAAEVVRYIEEHGWCQTVNVRPDGSVCLLGATAAICTGYPENGFGVLCGYRIVGVEDESQTFPIPRSAIEMVKLLSAETGIDMFAAEDKPNDYAVYRFNDSCTSADEVLAPLRRIAGLA